LVQSNRLLYRCACFRKAFGNLQYLGQLCQRIGLQQWRFCALN
jgi:predicted secreted protein